MNNSIEYLIILMHSVGATNQQISDGLAVSPKKVNEVIAVEKYQTNLSKLDIDINWSNLTFEDCTHLLHCAQNTNGVCNYEYNMPCIILRKITPTRTKILVFGDRNKPNTHHLKRTRIVEYHRLSEIK